MAGKAAKKAAKAGASTARLYFPIIVAVNAVYILFRLLYHFRSVSWWHAVGLLITSAIYYVSYQGVVEAAKMGIPAGTYFDLLVLTLISQTVSTFSSYGWYILLLIPAYYASTSGLWLFQQLQTRLESQHMEEELSERELKRQAKKERKASRGPRIKMR